MTDRDLTVSLKWSIDANVARLKRYYRHHGITEGAWLLGKRVLIKLLSPLCSYYETIIFEKHIAKEPVDMNTLPGIEVGFMSAHDIDGLKRMCNTGGCDFIERRLNRGERCVVAKNDENVCGFCWFNVGPHIVRDESKPLVISKCEAYIHEVFVSEPYRGKGIFSLMLGHAGIILKSEGCEKAKAMVYSSNFSSIRGFEKMGFEPTENIRYFKFPWLKKTFYRTGPVRLPARNI